MRVKLEGDWSCVTEAVKVLEAGFRSELLQDCLEAIDILANALEAVGHHDHDIHRELDYTKRELQEELERINAIL